MRFTSASAWLAALTLGGALVTAPASARASGQDDSRREEFKWQGQIQPGQDVEIRGVNGSIRTEPSSSGQVEVTAIKTGREQDPRSVQIVVVPHGGGVTLCAVYPAVDGEPNECRPGGGRNGVRNNDVNVEFHVRVPAGASFTGRTVNGSIDVKGLDGHASAHTVNGSVDLTTTSYADAKTVNGAIVARIGRADWQDTLSLKTVNGSIDLVLTGGGIDADLEARTVTGRITSDFPITVHEIGRRNVRGRLGSGGRGLSLETVNGSITLRSGA